MNQRGFATLEVILMVVVIGILASVAVPRFTDVTTKAHTAKIQADLTTIDTAIQMYYMDGKNKEDLNLDKLKADNYLMDVPTPPTGKAFIGKNKEHTISATSYQIKNDRATLDDKTAGDFSTTKTTPTTGD